MISLLLETTILNSYYEIHFIHMEKIDRRVIFTFLLVGKKTDINKYKDSIKDTISEVTNDTKNYIHVNNIVKNGNTVYVNISSTSRVKTNYKDIAKIIKKEFDEYFKPDKKDKFGGISLELQEISVDESLNKVEKSIKIPGYKVKDIHYQEEPEEDADEIIITASRDYDSNKKREKKNKRDNNIPSYYQIIIEGESVRSLPSIYYISEEKTTKEILKGLKKNNRKSWYSNMLSYDDPDPDNNEDFDEDEYYENKEKVRTWFNDNHDYKAEKKDPKIILKTFIFSE